MAFQSRLATGLSTTMAPAIGTATMKWSGSRATARGIIGFTANTSTGNNGGTTGKTAMMINKTMIATTIADKPAIEQFSETPARGPAFSETGRHQASQTYKNMKKPTIGTSL